MEVKDHGEECIDYRKMDKELDALAASMKLSEGLSDEEILDLVRMCEYEGLSRSGRVLSVFCPDGFLNVSML